MSGLIINNGFITEEVLEGAIGLELGHLDRTRVRAASAADIDEALDTVLGRDSHPIHEALNELVRDTVRQLEAISAERFLVTENLAEKIREALPEGVRVEQIDADAIGIGTLRRDGVYAVAVLRTSDGAHEIIYPDPKGPQQNVTDRVTVEHDPRNVPQIVRRSWDIVQAYSKRDAASKDPS